MKEIIEKLELAKWLLHRRRYTECLVVLASVQSDVKKKMTEEGL